MKKLISLVLAAVMLMALCVPAMAWMPFTSDMNNDIANIKTDVFNFIGDTTDAIHPWLYVDKMIYIDKSNITVNFENYFFIDYDCDDYYIYVDADNVTLNFKNCYLSTDIEDEKFPVIYVNGNNCTINGNGSTCFLSCKIDDEDGGAIYVNGEFCTIKGTSFDDCSGVDGGAICVNKDDCHVIDCSFTDCYASSEGGGIYVCNGADDFIASGCYFSGVSCGGKGQGQFIEGDNDSIVYNCSPSHTENEYYYHLCEFPNDDPLGFTLGSGNTWIIAVGAVVIICGLVAIMVANKKKKLTDANVETAEEAAETEEKEE